MRCTDIHLRDPFVVPVPEEGRYYMFGTTGSTAWEGGDGFDVYRSADLEHWEGPFPVFRPPSGFWATHNFWAPEVHAYQGRWYMLASFKAEGICRGTQVLVADHVAGPYAPHSPGPVTPCDWESLDGTLFIEDGQPWLVFCHEWLQIENGTIDAVRLAPDLRSSIGEPIGLFCADAPAWKGEAQYRRPAITDGPFLHRTASGTLLMLWSTNGPRGYALGVARSESGRLIGPWHHDHPPLFIEDGGHGMLFRRFEGTLTLVIHRPNANPHERPAFFGVVEEGGGLVIR
jgi:hypothetical protein